MTHENVATRISYRAYASGAIANRLVAAAPSASGATQIRRVRSTLNLTRDSYQAQEIVTHRQVNDMRLGTKRVSGEISGELSPGTYFPFYEAVARGTKDSAISLGPSALTSISANSGASTFTAAGGDPITSGLRVGDVIRFVNLSVAANNDVNFIITGFSGGSNRVIAVVPAPTTMSADTSFTLSRPGKKVFIPTSSHVRRLFGIEHYYQDSDLAELFEECRAYMAATQLPATGLATCNFGFMGRDKAQYSASAAPYFTSPTAETTTGIAAAVNGVLLVGGAVLGLVTGMEFTNQMAAAGPAVLGSDLVPEIYLGKNRVTGQMTALFEDFDLDDLFTGETEFEAHVLLELSGTAPVDFIKFTMTRCKFTGSNKELAGEEGIPITLPFQSLLKPTATGYDSTSFSITDSQAA